MFTKKSKYFAKFFDAYSQARIVHYLKDLDKLLDECETYKFDDKRRNKLKRYCRLLWHQDVFNKAVALIENKEIRK